MPDYAACNNTECSNRSDCCRYLMRRSERQVSLLMTGDGADCQSYWPVDKGAPFALLDAWQVDAELGGSDHA